MGLSLSTSSETDDRKTYRASPSASPSLSTVRAAQEAGALATLKFVESRSCSPNQSVYHSFPDDDVQEQDDDDHDQEDDNDTPPATPTTFAIQARNINNNSKDHRRLSSLCLDIRDAAETRGTNKDIRKACKWLLNREGVPQRLRTILWEQLLRGSDGYGGDCSGEDGDDEHSEDEGDEDVTLDGGIVDGVRGAGQVMGVWRRTSADPEVVDRLCRTALERAGGSTGSISRRSHALPLLPEEEGEEELEGGVELGNVQELQELTESISPRTIVTGDALQPLPMHEEEHEGGEGMNDALQQLRALAMEEPDFDPKCTCAAKCHCIYGVPQRRISRPAAAALTIRAGAAGMAPTDGLSPTSTSEASPTAQSMPGEPGIDLRWYDKKPTSIKWKMPEGKRDSIRPSNLDKLSPGSPTSGKEVGLQRDSHTVVGGHSPNHRH